MKKTMTLLAGLCAFTFVAQADVVSIDLPADGQPTYKNPGNIDQNADLIFTSVAANGIGTYMCANNGWTISVDGTECTLTSTPTANSNISEAQLQTLSGTTLEMWSRNGAGGENYTMVLGGGSTVSAGDTINSVTFSVGAIAGSTTSGYALRIGICQLSTSDAGTTTSTLVQSAVVSSVGNSGGTVTLTLDTPLVWSDEYVFVANIRSPQSTGYNNKSFVSGITLAADITPYVEPEPSPAVPEPATATLSLLALAGLAARRRRK